MLPKITNSYQWKYISTFQTLLKRNLYKRAPIQPNEYIPGIQGYSPEFQPPPPPKRSEKRLLKKQQNKKKIQVIPKANNNESKETKPFETLSYKEKLTQLRKQYKDEVQQLVKQREDQIKQHEEEKALKLQKEKEKVDQLAKETLKKRQEDYLSSLNVLSQEELTAALNVNETNPFTNPELKQNRLQRKDVNFVNFQTQLSQQRKEQLLGLFYEAEQFITPENIDERLKQVIEAPGSGFYRGLSSLTRSQNEENSTLFNESKKTRFNILEDVLLDQLDGKPNIEKIEKFKEEAKDSSWILKKTPSN